MSVTYSTYEAKARFSELIRRVRAGQRIRITHHGRVVAEIGPVSDEDVDLERRLERLETEGRLESRRHAVVSWDALAPVSGGLARFLEERE